VLAAASLVEVVAPGLLPFGDAGPGRAQGWAGHPNAWGASVIVPTVALAILSPRRLLPVGLVLAGIVLVLSGSRTALLATGAGTLLVLARHPRVLIAVLAVAASATAVVLAAGPNAWTYRFFPPQAAPAPNLLYASEALDAPGWSGVGVRVDGARHDAWLGTLPRPWTLTKTGAAWWSRVQQQIVLEPGRAYALTIEVRRDDPDALVGIHGVASEPYAQINAALAPGDGDPSLTEVRGQGVFDLDDARAEAIGGGWTRISVEWTVSGDAPVSLRIGPTPDQRRDRSGAVVQVRAVELSVGRDGVYDATFPGGQGARATLGTLSGRLSYFATAWRGFRASPWTGQPADAFTTFDTDADRGYRVGHAHNLFLQSAFEGGIVGLAGTILTLAGLALLAGAGAWPLVAVVVLANLLDWSFVVPNVGVALGLLVGRFGGRGTGAARRSR
jgi:hypothetical protein